MANRRARGQATPTVTFDFQSPQGASFDEVTKRKYRPGEGYSYVATTVLRYDGPVDAGMQRWPALTLTAEQSKKSGVTAAELEKRYSAKRELRDPGFWRAHRLGFEPRTYSVIESVTVKYPAASRPASKDIQQLVNADLPTAPSSSTDIVFGFDLALPLLHKSKTFSFLDVEDLTFSVDIEWDLGLRMPMSGVLQSPQPMAEGSTYTAGSSLTGRNWIAEQYAAVGLPSEHGHEVYFRFVGQACVEFSGPYDDKSCFGPEEYRSSDFVTPLGSGNLVAFPPVSIELLNYGIAGIDLNLEPSVGSDRITADWNVLGAAIGGGQLTYTGSGAQQNLTPVRAIDGPGQALFSVDGFLYHFTQFSLSPSLNVWVDLHVSIPFAPDIDWDDNKSFDLGTYDLSDIIDSEDLAVAIHHNDGYTGASRLTLSVPVVNVAPTATISAVAGGQQEVLSGIPTIIANTGQALTFTGRSHDPGRDDLTLSWDWGDGAPTPDVSTLYSLNAPAGPNDATDARAHAFDRACLYDVTFKSVDDDAASSEDHASILITETGKPSRLEGFWQHQLGRQGGGLLDVSAINCYLAIVDRVSAVFSERRAVSKADAAFDIVNIAQNSGSESQQLDRELLVAWLNFASGAIGYSQLVDTDGDGSVDTPFSQAIRGAELIRLDASSATDVLRAATEMVHRISVQFTGKGGT